MSNLDINFGNIPNFKNSEETDRYLSGKPTRAEVMTDMQKMWENVLKVVAGQSEYISTPLAKANYMSRLNGLQIETLLRLITKAIPDFLENFQKELQKTLDFVRFLDSINPPGEFSEKPIREKLDMVRAWNAGEDHELKVKGEHFRLPQYINTNSAEFTEEEVQQLNKEFEMDVTLPTKVEVNV